MNSFITVMHRDAHTSLHCQVLSPLFLFQRCLCVSQNELALSLPSVGNARELHGKLQYIWSPVRLEVSSIRSVTVAICSLCPGAAGIITEAGQEVSILQVLNFLFLEPWNEFSSLALF
jgi:hypothetical protein